MPNGDGANVRETIDERGLGVPKKPKPPAKGNYNVCTATEEGHEKEYIR